MYKIVDRYKHRVTSNVGVDAHRRVGTAAKRMELHGGSSRPPARRHHGTTTPHLSNTTKHIATSPHHADTTSRQHRLNTTTPPPHPLTPTLNAPPPATATIAGVTLMADSMEGVVSEDAPPTTAELEQKAIAGAYKTTDVSCYSTTVARPGVCFLLLAIHHALHLQMPMYLLYRLCLLVAVLLITPHVPQSLARHRHGGVQVSRPPG